MPMVDSPAGPPLFPREPGAHGDRRLRGTEESAQSARLPPRTVLILIDPGDRLIQPVVGSGELFHGGDQPGRLIRMELERIDLPSHGVSV